MSIILVELKLCSALEYDEVCTQFTIGDVMSMYVLSVEKEQQHYELMSQAFRVGYVNAKSNKNHKMFKERQAVSGASKTVERYESKEGKDKALQELMGVFSEDAH